jgi:hypothetical protein
MHCRIELAKLTWLGDSLFDRSESATAWYLRPRLVVLSAIMFAIAVVWLLIAGNSTGRAESEPVPPVAATIQPTVTSAGSAAAPTDVSLKPALPEQAAPAEPAAVNGLKISSQSWRRGGLGSNALFTFTLRNNNEYAVKDVEIHCAFTRRDGSHLTERTRVIPDTIEMKSRKTFTRMHVGFVNVNASKAICSLVTASRI